MSTEYKCRSCGTTFEINTGEKAECPKCGADNPQKVMSVFSSLRNFIKWLGKSNCGANTGFS